MSAQELMLKVALERRRELASEIQQREDEIAKSKTEEEGWRKEAQAALEMAAECERQRERLHGQIEMLMNEGDAIDRLCGVSRKTLPSPKVETTPPVLEAPTAPELPPVPHPLDTLNDLQATILARDADDGVRYEGETLRPEIPDESINAAAMRLLTERPSRFIKPTEAAQYLFAAHPEWRSHLTHARLTKRIEKLYQNRARSGEIREHVTEKGRGEPAYQAILHRAKVEHEKELEQTKLSHREASSRGGKAGGKARWEGVPAEDRSEQARKMAAARWAKRKVD